MHFPQYNGYDMQYKSFDQFCIPALKEKLGGKKNNSQDKNIFNQQNVCRARRVLEVGGQQMYWPLTTHTRMVSGV